MTVINTNVGALMARTYAARANNTMTTSMERLSSGQRINSAADDAAGLAVANKMESQHRGIKMAMRNSKDGISLVQTAESAMQEVTNMVLRMRELAVQMDNGVYTAKDRDNAQLEINALIAEIDKIAANTRFNDVVLLDGSYDQTIRSGNTNAETTRISLNSLFAKDNGSGSSITDQETSFVSRPAATTPADFTIEAANLLSARLGISATSYGSLGESDSEAVLSNIVSDAEYRHHGGNTLLLKDNVADLGYSYATVSLTDQQWEKVADNLDLTKRLYNEIASLDPTAAEYATKAAQIGQDLAGLEIERSQYIGSLFHANEIDLQGVHVGGGLTSNKYAEVINVYSDPDSKQSISRQIAAVEIDFQELTKELHDPRSCPHCIAKAGSGAVGGAGVANGSGGAGGFTDGFDADGNRYAAIATTHTGTGSGYAAAASPSGGLSSIISGSKWNSVGNDGGGAKLSYSYWDGSSPHDYTRDGTRTTLDSHSSGSNNSTAHDLVFAEWDAVSAFAFEKIAEDGDGDPVGDLRVHVLDTMPSGAAAYAFYPSNSPQGGDIYYGASIMGSATDTDFVTEGYNWYTALHEIGHALGLSHPFDGGAADGSTLNLNLDSQRNTVMTYVQTDRNVRIANSGGSLSIGNRVNISTPGLLDIEAMEHLYGSGGWSHNNTNTTYGGGAGIDAFNNNYDSIRVIADSGGEQDTIDASGVTATGNIIDLTPGTYSSINYYATDAEKIAAVAGGSQSAIDWFTGQVANYDATASAANDHYSGYTRTALYRGQENVGIAHNTWIENAKGGAGADTITGNSMGNELTGNGGDDTIDGAGGIDVAIFSGNRAAYTVTGTASASTVSGTDGNDTLTNVEFLKFDDGVWSVADAVGGAGATHANIAAAGVTASRTKTGAQTGGVTNGDGATNIGNLKLKDVKIETQADAQNAVTILNRSLEQIASGRAKLGAVSNRLTHNLDNQTQASMLTQQARGRVVDTDMAIESTKLAQEQILSQAAQQAINMATQRQQTVLQLLET